MKKTILNILIFTCSGTLLFSEGGADNSGQESAGEVGFSASWTVTALADLATPWTGLANTDYEADHFLIDNYFTISEIDVNAPFFINVTRSAWSIPTNYMDAGTKQTAGAGIATDADLLIAVDISDDGYAADNATGLREADTYGSHAYVALSTESATPIFDGGGTGLAAEHGVESADGTVDVKVLMDWVYDIPGVYAITLTLSLSPNPN